MFRCPAKIVVGHGPRRALVAVRCAAAVQRDEVSMMPRPMRAAPPPQPASAPAPEIPPPQAPAPPAGPAVSQRVIPQPTVAAGAAVPPEVTAPAADVAPAAKRPAARSPKDSAAKSVKAQGAKAQGAQRKTASAGKGEQVTLPASGSGAKGRRRSSRRGGSKAKAGEAKSSEAKVSEAKVNEAKSSEAKGSEAKSSEAKVSEAKAGEAKGSKAKGSKAKSSEAKGTEAKSSEAKSSETKGSEAKSSEAIGTEAKAGEAKGSKAKSSEAKGGEPKGDKAGQVQSVSFLEEDPAYLERDATRVYTDLISKKKPVLVKSLGRQGAAGAVRFLLALRAAGRQAQDKPDVRFRLPPSKPVPDFGLPLLMLVDPWPTQHHLPSEYPHLTRTIRVDERHQVPELAATLQPAVGRLPPGNFLRLEMVGIDNIYNALQALSSACQQMGPGGPNVFVIPELVMGSVPTVQFYVSRTMRRRTEEGKASPSSAPSATPTKSS